jgi:hypothetical protein
MRAPHRWALAAIALVAIALLSPSPSHAGGKPPRALDILITNDDGWIGPGGASTPLIVALRDALAATATASRSWRRRPIRAATGRA